MRTWRNLAIVFVLQALALVYMVAAKQWTLSTGATVVLETRPIDPRSLFSGDYVRLNYAISDLDLEALGGDDEFKRRDTIYVVLQPGEPYWRPTSVHQRMPALPVGEVCIKGEVQWAQHERWNEQTQRSEKARSVQVHYGIENYFVPEGEGLALERPKAGEKISIRVAVDKSGNAGIKAVLVNGKERYVEKLL